MFAVREVVMLNGNSLNLAEEGADIMEPPPPDSFIFKWREDPSGTAGKKLSAAAQKAVDERAKEVSRPASSAFTSQEFALAVLCRVPSPVPTSTCCNSSST